MKSISTAHAGKRRQHGLSLVIPALMALLAMPGAAAAQVQPEQPAQPAQPLAPVAQPAPAQPLAPVAAPAPAQSAQVAPAQPVAAIATPAPAQQPAPAAGVAMPVVEEKSPAKALQYSLFGTLGSVGVIITGSGMKSGELVLLGLGGLLVTPSFGQFYAGDRGRGWGQVGVRALALSGSLVASLFVALDCGLTSECSPSSPAALVMFGGLGVAAGSAIYSVYDAPRAARRQNAKLRARQLMLTPAPMASPGQSSGFGLHLSGRF